MEIAILTSSRADFGFYRPLLDLLKNQKKIKPRLVVFGTHLSKKHGYTVKNIKALGYKVFKEIDTMIEGDSPEIISEIIGKTHLKFATFWKKNKIDLILCLGDRYEMFAAISSSIPFNIPVAHISGGEETLGAIDNVYRHAITLMSKYHFTNTEKNAERVIQILNNSKNVYFTGSLAVDNINNTKIITAKEFKKVFNFDISQPFILFTFHPETVNYKQNSLFASEISKFLISVKVNVLVTMPNADTMGNTIRENLIVAAKLNKHITLAESLGSEGYYTALSKCLFVMGNSSSGIVEAASFGKYVVNMGDRQKGRERGKNIVDIEINYLKILQTIDKVKKLKKLDSENIYGDGKAAKRIIDVLKKIK